MEIYVHNVEFDSWSTTYSMIAVIDTFKSLIWTKRYYTNGDFELCVPADDELLKILKPGNWLTREDDDSVMVIESITIQTDVENGDVFIVSGKSLEYILGFRVIYPQIRISTNDVVQAIKAIITHCTPSMRGLPGLTIDDSFQVSASISKQFTGQNLLTTISEICQQFHIGFKMTLSSGGFTLSFYEGQDTEVVFAPEFDNLINSNYVFDKTNYNNCAFVAGEGEGTNRKAIGVYLDYDMIGGLLRRELFVDARDISSNNGEIDTQEYYKLLGQRGKEKLAEHQVTSGFDAEVEPNMNYRYKEDWNLGDIVTIKNEHGITARPRIVEIIESWDDTGYKIIPTFEELEILEEVE